MLTSSFYLQLPEAFGVEDVVFAHKIMWVRMGYVVGRKAAAPVDHQLRPFSCTNAQ